jgi:hypothetical protein
MKKYLLAAAAALALGGSAFAQEANPTPRFEDGTWLLLTLNWGNGSGYYAPNTYTLPSFDTQRACQNRLTQELNRHAGVSHANGGDIGLLCINRNALALPR